MADNSLARLAATHPELEIWWDSSPLIFESWRKEVLEAAAGTPFEPRAKEILEDIWSLFVGCTTNPPLTKQVVDRDPAPWEEWIRNEVAGSAKVDHFDVFWKLYSSVVKKGAEAFLEVHEKSNGKLGYISGQVDPRVLQDTRKMVAQAIALNSMSPNIMIKMPGTKEGIYGITILTAMGIPTNATLTFTLSQLMSVAEAVKVGLELARKNGVDLSAWRSVITLMLGRMEDCKVFHQQAEELGIELSEADRRWAGIAVFNKALRLIKERGYESKLLAASMRLGPTVDGKQRVWHLEKLAGKPVVLTIFPNVIETWLREYDGEEIDPSPEDAPPEVIEKLLKIPYFNEAYNEGQPQEEFINHGAVIETANQFSQATNDLQEFVRERIGKS